MRACEKAYKLPTPRKEKNYLPFDRGNLRDFARLCSLAYKENNIDEQFISSLIDNFNRHFLPRNFDPSATKPVLDEILIRFSAIYEMLKDPQIPADKKTMIACKIEERIGQCTAGFLIGLQDITSDITGNAFTMESMLYSIRYSICDKLAFELAQAEVHKHNIVFIEAKDLGFGVKPSTEKENDVYYFNDYYQPFAKSCRDEIVKAFNLNYRFPYVFSHIMDEINTLYQSESIDNSLTVEGATAIKTALKQLFPQLTTIEETQKQYEIELERLGTLFNALLQPFQFTPSELSSFDPTKTYTQEELDSLKSALTAKAEEKTSAPAHKRLALMNEIKTLETKIAVYQKVLPHKDLITEKFQQDYRALTSSIKEKKEHPPQGLDEFLFLTDEDTGKQTLNVKKIRGLLWQELSSNGYFEFSPEEKEKLSIIFNTEASDTSIQEKLEKLIAGAENLELFTIYINSFQGILKPETISSLLKKKLASTKNEDVIKIIKLLNLDSKLYPGLFNLFNRYTFDSFEPIYRLIQGNVSNEKIILFLEHIKIQNYTTQGFDRSLKAVLEACHGHKKELIIPLLKKRSDYNRSKDMLTEFLNQFDYPEIRDQIIAWYQEKNGPLDLQFINQHIDSMLHKITTSKKYTLIALLKNNPDVRISITEDRQEIIKNFLQSFPKQISSFELTKESLLEFLLNPDYLFELRSIIPHTITPAYLRHLNLSADEYNIILPYCLEKFNEDTLNELNKIETFNAALQNLDISYISGIFDNPQLPIANKQFIITKLSGQLTQIQLNSIYQRLPPSAQFDLLKNIQNNLPVHQDFYNSQVLQIKAQLKPPTSFGFSTIDDTWIMNFVTHFNQKKIFFSEEEQNQIVREILSSIKNKTLLSKQKNFMYLLSNLKLTDTQYQDVINELKLYTLKFNEFFPGSFSWLSNLNDESMRYFITNMTIKPPKEKISEEIFTLVFNLISQERNELINTFLTKFKLIVTPQIMTEILQSQDRNHEQTKIMIFDWYIANLRPFTITNEINITNIPLTVFKKILENNPTEKILITRERREYIEKFLQNNPGFENRFVPDKNFFLDYISNYSSRFSIDLNCINADFLRRLNLSLEERPEVISFILSKFEPVQLNELLPVFFEKNEVQKFKIPDELLSLLLSDTNISEEKKIWLIKNIVLKEDYFSWIKQWPTHQKLLNDAAIQRFYTQNVIKCITEQLKNTDLLEFLLHPVILNQVTTI